MAGIAPGFAFWLEPGPTRPPDPGVRRRRADANRAEVELGKRDAEQTQYQADFLTRSAQLVRLLNLAISASTSPSASRR